MKKLFYIIALFGVYSAMAQFSSNRLQSPYIGGVVDIEVGPNDLIFVGTWGDGVKSSNDGGENFDDINSGLSNRWVNQVKYDDGILLAATLGGVFKSTNDGNSWTDISNEIPGEVTAVWISSSSIYYAGTRGDGLFKTEDGGDSWMPINNGLDFWDILYIFELDNGTLLASTNGDGIYKSEDDGVSWERSNAGISSDYVNEIKYDPDGDLWASTLDRGLYQSDDGAISWFAFMQQGLLDLQINGFSFFQYELTNTYYPIVSTMKYGIWKFNALPTVFEFEVTRENTSGFKDIELLSDNTMLAANPNGGFMISDDLGDDFSNSSTFLNSNDELTVDASENYVFIGGPDGLYRSEDYGKSFELTSIQDPVAHVSINEDIVVASLVDGEVFISSNNGVDFESRPLPLGDPGAMSSWAQSVELTKARFTDDRIVIGVTNFYFWQDQGDPTGPPPWDQYWDSFYTTDLGATWNDSNDDNPFSPAPSTDLQTVDNNVYSVAGGNSPTFFYSSNQGDSWQEQSTDFTTENVKAMDMFSTSVVAVGTNQSILFSLDRGINWTDESIDLQQEPTLNLTLTNNVRSIHTPNQSEIYAGLERVNGLHYSANRGGDWTQIDDHIATTIDFIESNEDGDLFFGNYYVNRRINERNLDAPVPVSLPANTNNVAVDINDAEGRVPAIFTWDEVEKADMYHIEVSAAENFGGKVVDIVYNRTSHTITEILEGSTVYYWRVRSRANGVYSDWSPVLRFTTELAVPELVYPINDQIGVPVNASMTWNAVDLATSYDIQISEDETLQNIVMDEQEITSASITATGLMAYSDYVWRVRANNGDSKGRWSEFESFTTVSGAPTQVFPPDMSFGIPTELEFRFDGVDGGEEYFIQVSQDADMADELNFLIDRDTDTDSTHFTEFLNFNETYYWRMQSAVLGSVNNEEVTYKSEFSPIFTFTTGAVAPNLLSPDDGSVDISTEEVELRWSSVTDASEYEVQLSSSNTFGDFILNETQEDREITQEGLEGYSTYFWRARAFVDEIPGAWSEVWSFRTWLLGPTTTFPDCGFTNINPNEVRLVWDRVDGADLYEVQVDELSNFEDPIIIDEISSDRVDVPGLENEKTYFWRVRGYNEESTGQWSDICEFATSPSSVRTIFGSDEDISVYPNPASDEFKLSLFAKQNTTLTINLIPISGDQTIQLYTGVLKVGANSFKFDTDRFTSGKYIVEIVTGEGSTSKDLLISK